MQLSEEEAARHFDAEYRDYKVRAALAAHDAIRHAWWHTGYAAWWAGVDGMDRGKPRPHWKRPGLGLTSFGASINVRRWIAYKSGKRYSDGDVAAALATKKEDSRGNEAG